MPRKLEDEYKERKTSRATWWYINMAYDCRIPSYVTRCIIEQCDLARRIYDLKDFLFSLDEAKQKELDISNIEVERLRKQLVCMWEYHTILVTRLDDALVKFGLFE